MEFNYKPEELPKEIEDGLYKDKNLQGRVKDAEKRYERGESIVCNLEDLRKEIAGGATTNTRT